jgi:anhydro-N-acetylmuramic acid kinase
LFAEDFAVRTLSLAQQQGWSAHDILCTATQFVARVIGQTLDGLFTKSEIPQVIILTGVGVRNGLLLKLLEEALHGHQFVNSDTVGVPAEGIDAVHAGLLACLTLDNVGANCPAATGATGVRLLGSLTPGTNLNWSWCLANMLDRADRYLEED